jgi:hypothetical protein
LAATSRVNFGRYLLEISVKDRKALSSILATIIIAAITIAIVISGSYWVGGLVNTFVRNEKIEIKTIYIVKNGENYVITINYVNTGSRTTSIDSITMNGVPASDYTPAIILGSDFDSLPSICETGVNKIGTLTVQAGAVDPSGNRINSGSTLEINLCTTNGEKYSIIIVLF